MTGHREGFEGLVAEVALGQAGIILALECSRLARNSADWHQLPGLCGMTGTLICDEDGLYDPRNFNDRLLLGMKGQLSEHLCGLRHNISQGYSCKRTNFGSCNVIETWSWVQLRADRTVPEQPSELATPVK